jgi:hypothetical protein
MTAKAMGTEQGAARAEQGAERDVVNAEQAMRRALSLAANGPAWGTNPRVG